MKFVFRSLMSFLLLTAVVSLSPASDVGLKSDQPEERKDGLQSRGYADIQKHMEKMRKLMESNMKAFFDKDPFADDFFANKDHFGAGSMSGQWAADSSSLEIKQYDEGAHHLIEIPLTEATKDGLKIDVLEGKVRISGRIEKTEETSGDRGKRVFKSISTFNKVIPLSEDLEHEQAKIENQEGRILIRIPKRRV